MWNTIYKKIISATPLNFGQPNITCVTDAEHLQYQNIIIISTKCYINYMSCLLDVLMSVNESTKLISAFVC